MFVSRIWFKKTDEDDYRQDWRHKTDASYVFDILVRTDHNARESDVFYNLPRTRNLRIYIEMYWIRRDKLSYIIIKNTTRSQGWWDVQRCLRFGQDDLSIFITINELRLALSAQEEWKRIHTSMTAKVTKSDEYVKMDPKCYLYAIWRHISSMSSVLGASYSQYLLSFYISNLLTFLVFWIYVTILIVVKIKMTLIDVISENTTQ